jgi:cytochrome P450
MLASYTINPMDAGFFIRPDYHEVLATLRSEAPVFEYGPGLWTVARYEDIRDLSRNPGLFCSGRGALVNDPIRGSDNPMSTPSILHMDPPEHSSFRSLLNRRFTPRSLAPLADSIRQTAREMIAQAEPAGEIDFVAELSAPFPLAVIAELLGIPDSDRSDFRRWSDAAIESPDRPAGETLEALGELARFISGHIASKRDSPGRRLPAHPGPALHVPPHLAGGRQRDHPDAPVGHCTGARRVPRPAGRAGGRPVVAAGCHGGVPSMGHAGAGLLPHGH